ncbi:hemoglobin/transferrin/lactoferrin receptor protein [Microvirga lupini]|uniref:Hemoglobin/transferrin/lactoferrin receptor protein n=1 Tax=Microvirga lupini TaxID=420324 RepID=A0A7W4VQ18_9HYPH|nr:TonB-dependent receptor [Microvirga lupini]MBB3021116.1 hemoglobin/transferrin/lactoferrin receptor protein [Microvirga lupini]
MVKSNLLCSAVSLPVLLLCQVQPGVAQQPLVLDQITVEGAGRADPNAELAVTAEDIERENPQDLKQLFLDDPAITVAGGSVASQKFYLHGIDQNKLNVQIDGAQQKSNVWHHNGNIIINPLVLKAVQVDSAVSPADAGPGALGGTVRFETKDVVDLILPGRTHGGFLSTGFDTNSRTVNVTGAGYGMHNGFEALGLLTREEGQDYRNGFGKEEAGTAADLVSGLAKLAYESPEGHRFQVSQEYIQDKGYRRLRPNLGFVNPLFNNNEARRYTTTFRYLMTKPTDDYNPEVLFYYNQNDLDRPFGNYGRPAGDFESSTKSMGGKVQNTFGFGFGSLTTGLDFVNTRASVKRFYFPDDVREESTNLGAYLQARLRPIGPLIISTGLRLDHQWYKAVDGQELQNSGLSPNLSAEYFLTKHVSLFGGYSYNFGGIELAETALFHARDYTYAGDLNPTKAHNVRAGVRLAAYHGFSAEAAYFHTLMLDPVAYDFTNAMRINGENLRSQGVDLSVRYDWANAFISAKYTHADVRYGDRIALPGDYNNGITVGDIFTLSGAYTWQEYGLTLGASAEFAPEIDDPALRAEAFYPFEAYNVINAFLEWAPTQKALQNVTVRADVRNIFDEEYYSRGSYGQTDMITPAYSPGRSVYLSANVKF